MYTIKYINPLFQKNHTTFDLLVTDDTGDLPDQRLHVDFIGSKKDKELEDEGTIILKRLLEEEQAQTQQQLNDLQAVTISGQSVTRAGRPPVELPPPATEEEKQKRIADTQAKLTRLQEQTKKPISALKQKAIFKIDRPPGSTR